MTTEFNSYLFLIYVICGLSFMMLGLTAYLVPKSRTGIKFSSNLPWLAIFGTLYGAFEFIGASQLLLGSELYDLPKHILLSLSFIALFEFGREIVFPERLLKFRPTLLLYFSLGLVVMAFYWLSHFSGTGLSIGIRYCFGFIGALLAGFGIFRIKPEILMASTKPVKLWSGLLGSTFIVYGAMILLHDSTAPSLIWLMTSHDFYGIFGIQPEIVKIIFALTAVVSLASIASASLKNASDSLQRFTNALDGFYLTIESNDGLKIQSVSDGIQTKLGVASSALISRPLTTYLSLVFENDRSMVSEKIEHAFGTGENLHINYRITDHEEKSLWVNQRGHATADATGHKVLESIVIEDTYRQLTQQEIEKSKDLLERAESLSKTGSWELDIKTNKLIWSKQIYQIFELDPLEFEASYEAFLKAIHPDDRQKVNAAYLQSLTDRTPYSIKHRLEMSDGRIKHVKETCETHFNDEGEPLYSTGTVQDISEQVKAQIEIKRLASIVEHAHDFIGISDLEGNVFFVNDYGKKLLGVEDDEQLLNTKIVDYFPEEEHARIYEEILPKLFDKGRWIGEINFQHLQSREKILMLYDAFSIKDPDTGEVIALATITRDIREDKLAEQALVESEARYKRAERGTNDGLWEWNIQTDQVFYSVRWLQILGYKPNELEKNISTFRNLVHPEDKQLFERTINANLAGDEILDQEFRLKHKQGQYIWVRSRGETERSEDGMPLLMTCSMTDITLAKEQEMELIKHQSHLAELVKEKTKELTLARDVAEKANKAKSDFLSRMSHELRTPLNAILGFSQLITTDPLEPLSKNQLENMNEVMIAANHLLELINEVLDLARIESGKQYIAQQDVNLAHVLEESISTLGPLAKERQIKVSLSTKLPADQNSVIKSDPTRLKQVFVNLIANAIKYNHLQGEVNVSVELKSSQYFEVVVEDKGPGIAEDYHHKIFQPFERGDLSQHDIEGSGIGLAISKEIVESMGGEIGFKSELGSGSCFWFKVPVEPSTN